jgi:hypothetical protein
MIESIFDSLCHVKRRKKEVEKQRSREAGGREVGKQKSR